METALALIKRFYGPVAVIVAACLAWLLFRAGVVNVDLRMQLSKAQAALTATQKKLTDAETAYEDLIRDYNDQARAADARERALEQDRLAAVDKVRREYGTRLASADRSLQLALDGLRHSADADRRRALKPAADSPAACRDHAADPTRLSLPHAEFLIREADRADRVAVQAIACQQYADEVVKQGDAK
jgi:hypothetical protein